MGNRNSKYEVAEKGQYVHPTLKELYPEQSQKNLREYTVIAQQVKLSGTIDEDAELDDPVDLGLKLMDSTEEFNEFIATVKDPLSDGEFSDSKSVSANATMSAEYFKKSCENVKYGDLLRDPDEYLMKPIHVKGKIVQWISNEQFHFNITKGSYNYWDDRAWLVLNYPPEENIIEDDIVEVWGFGGGNETYETAIGGTNTIPVIFAEYIDIIQKAD